MPIVPAKCPQCGADIEVDTTHSHYLQRTLSLFSIMNERIRDTVSIQNALTELKFNAPFGAEQRINAADSNNITILNQLNGAALLLKISIPTESIFIAP